MLYLAAVILFGTAEGRLAPVPEKRTLKNGRRGLVISVLLLLFFVWFAADQIMYHVIYSIYEAFYIEQITLIDRIVCFIPIAAMTFHLAKLSCWHKRIKEALVKPAPQEGPVPLKAATQA